MTYRSIFVHVDDTPEHVHRLAVAATLASRFPAEIQGSYLVARRAFTPTEAALIPQELLDSQLDAMGRAQAAAEARFRAALRGATSIGWSAPAGDPIDAAVLGARHADLAIVGQPLRSGPDSAFSQHIAQAVVMGSGRPVLVVPWIGAGPTLGERVLIAWKDSRESARAVADALPLLKQAKQVLALAIQPSDERTLHDHLADRAVEAFLDRHAIAASVQRTVAPDVAAGEDLLSRAADFGADLIVMGGYSRPRLARWVWGGVSNTMLESMTVPVLMSH
jgi:nucleotide-binding universal stress UspA family protein